MRVLAFLLLMTVPANAGVGSINTRHELPQFPNHCHLVCGICICAAPSKGAPHAR